jgi:hypothetical protein
MKDEGRSNAIDKPVFIEYGGCDNQLALCNISALETP